MGFERGHRYPVSHGQISPNGVPHHWEPSSSVFARDAHLTAPLSTLPGSELAHWLGCKQALN